MRPAQTHLHVDDCPRALAILNSLFDARRTPVGGFEPTECGAWVTWDQLSGTSVLSTSEIAAVHVARGCALAERTGGLPTSVRAAIVDAVADLSGRPLHATSQPPPSGAERRAK